MDAIGIILTIAACIGGLIVLYFVIAGTIFLIASKRTKAAFDERAKDFGKGFDSEFFKRNR